MATERSAGAGGKFRKKASRSSTQSTPYDRPASALRPTSQLRENLNNNGWLSKLVDPASRLITAGAHKLFSSVFRKRLLPPPHHPPPEETMEKTGNVQQEVTTMVAPSGSKEPVVFRGDDSKVSHNGGVAELEDILKQKTFTRSEIDHLTALLLSRTDEKLAGAQMASLGPKPLDEMVGQSRHEVLSNVPAVEKGARHGLPAAISTPDVRSKALEDAVASPAELAKAYMGSRPSRASPSVVGMQNEMPREDLSAQYNPFMKQNTPASSLIQKPANDIGGSANGFMTPRFRGRSAIYSMARTPYSRPQHNEVFKPAETASNVHGASSSARNASETQKLSGSNRQVLKRRSSVLESDIGFAGPIRRIRQKPNLLNHKTLSYPASVGSNVKHGYGALTNVTEAPSSIDWSSKHHSSSKALTDNGTPSTSNGYVPSQSIEMAQKIFQQLDKFTSKGKSPEKSVDIAEGSSSGKMTSDMRDVLAHKRTNTAGSLKVWKSVQDSRKENGLLDSISTHDHKNKVASKAEESCSKMFDMPSAVDAKAGSPDKPLDHVTSQPNFDHRQKRRAFQMSAHEDYLELDDDVQTNGVVSTPVIKGVESHELAKNSSAFSGNPQIASNSAGESSTPEPKPSTFLFGTNKEEPLPEGSSSAQKVSGFAVPAIPPSSAICTSTQAAVSSPQSTAGIVNDAEQSAKTSVFPASGSNFAKMTPFPFSTSSSIVESAAANDIKSEIPSSATYVAAKTDGADKFDRKNTPLFGDASKKVGDASNEASSAKGIFSFGLTSNSETVSNGLPNAVTVTTGVSSPVQVSSSTNYLSPVPVSVSSPSLFSFSNGGAVSTSSSAAPAGTVITTATTGSMATLGSNSSQLSTSMTAPFAFGPTFQFGSSAAPTSSTAVTSASESAAFSGAKSNQFTVGNAASSMSSAKPSGTDVGNDISGFNSAFKTATSEAQTAASAVANGSIFGLQASSSAVPVSMSMPGFSSQSTSSASSPVFGSNTFASFNASNSIFGTSSMVANPFASGSTASNASGSSSVTEPVSSSSNASPSIFGWQSSKSTVPGSMFGTSFQSTGFSVGSTASGTSAAGNSNPIVFGATSNSSAASNSSPFVFGSGPSVASAPSSTHFPSQPAFGSSTPQNFPFSSTPPAGNNDRMSMEDSMAEDSVHVSTPAAPVFGVQNAAPSSAFAFGAAAPSSGNPFQFGGQPNQIAPQNSPFQPSGSLEFNAGGGAGGAGSFSLGSGGGDKANRRFVKVKKGVRRK